MGCDMKTTQFELTGVNVQSNFGKNVPVNLYNQGNEKPQIETTHRADQHMSTSSSSGEQTSADVKTSREKAPATYLNEDIDHEYEEDTDSNVDLPFKRKTCRYRIDSDSDASDEKESLQTASTPNPMTMDKIPSESNLREDHTCVKSVIEYEMNHKRIPDIVNMKHSSESYQTYGVQNQMQTNENYQDKNKTYIYHGQSIQLKELKIILHRLKNCTSPKMNDSLNTKNLPEKKNIDDVSCKHNFQSNFSEYRQNKQCENKVHMQTINTDINGTDEDIEFVNITHGERPDKYFKFLPLQEKQKRTICAKFGINYTGENHYPVLNESTYIGTPSRIKNIIADGNCFFRAISYAISGTQANHSILRRVTVRHLLETNDLFRNTLRPGFLTVPDYIFKQRIMNTGTWATDTEISAIANLLDFDIYSYNDQVPCWQIFSAKEPGGINIVTSKNGIYIVYTQNVHFNVVESVNNNLSLFEHTQQIDRDNIPETSVSGTSNVYVKTSTVPNTTIKQTKKRKFTSLGEHEIFSHGNESLKECMEPKLKHKKYVEDLNSTNNKNSVQKRKYRKKKSVDARKREKKELMRVKRAKENFENVIYENKEEIIDDTSLRKIRNANAMRKKYATDPKYRLAKQIQARQAQRNMYCDVTFKSHKQKQVREKKKQMYKTDPDFKFKLLNTQKTKYETDFKHKQNKKNNFLQKYRFNNDFRQNFKKKVSQAITEKYWCNSRFRQKLKEKIRKKYQCNLRFRRNFKEKIRQKYQCNLSFRQNFKENMRKKYQCNSDFRQYLKEKVKRSSKVKYKSSLVCRQKKANRNLRYRKMEQQRMSNSDYVLKNFRKTVAYGPEFVCCVCLKVLFENQVLKCMKAKYKNKTCINENYLHICNANCDEECQVAKSSRRCLWICFTCHRKLSSNKLPGEAAINNLKLHDIPDELQDLNNLEQHLIAMNIPFMKLMNLPKGGQHGIHGPVVCVPSKTIETVEMLPRPESGDQMIRVKLKRKLSYKGHYEYKFVNKPKVLRALHFLQKNNKYYSNITINEEWNNYLSEQTNKDNHANVDNQSFVESDVDEDPDERLGGIQLDTCLQPVDLRQEILDQYFDDIICCAPCEGNSPVALLRDGSNEAKCFPVLFPAGQPTYHDARSVNLTLGRYLHNRLMHVDNRFARNTEFIFYAQCIYEIQQMMSSVSIALRKGSDKNDESNLITVSDLRNVSKIQEILKSDKGYKFLKNIRGTPPYWQSTQKDVLAMVRQLGKPTWFASFSSADMRWPEIMNTLLSQTGDKRKLTDLDWAEKCNLLKSNPVTIARMFDVRFHTFLNKVILSKAQPIGKIIDYFYRIEFQQRGSPHTHCLFWVQDAPELGVDPDEEVLNFIDKYIACNIPNEEEDEELHEIVTSVQIHSKKHSKSCKKKGTTCRFNFPRPPSEKTFFIRPANDIENNNNDNEMERGKQILTKIKEAFNDERAYNSTRELFEDLNITQNEFEKANNRVAYQESIVLKRNPKDVWVNQYNSFLLRTWNANMDLQFVSNVYACIAYIVSYMSKSEREMGLLLSHAESEMKEGNKNAKEGLKQLGNVYMQNREVSAQESVFRVCSLRLKECSRKVEFIPVGPNPVRMSLPLNVIQNKQDDQSAWMPNKLDKYKARPDDPEFENMCLATFCSRYRMLSSSEIKTNKQNQNKFKLKNNLGYIQKRTRTGDAVVRYPRFSPNVSSEKYYLSILQLFLPYRSDEQLKPSQFHSHQEFYEKGSVKISNNNLQMVKSIVQTNLQQYEKSADAIEQAQEYIEKFGVQEDAWGLLCPETEVERLENPKPNVEVEDEEVELNMPDLQFHKKEGINIESRSNTISRQESNTLIRSLNDKQQHVFYKTRKWCLDKVNGKQPEPFYVFVTGGAGTGKSHLVKCIYNEGTRILSKMMHNPDEISILKIAPTGIAAYNINGNTIHTSLSIPITMSLPYQPLGEEKISLLRAKLNQLQIVIIDEISMVDQKLLWYIHGRLRQIKQSRNDSPFGNVSILAVGDFYQLPPVGGTALYRDTLQNSLWMDNFKQVHLDQIMRQKEDREFAILLNKLRVKETDQILSDQDLTILKSCQTGEQCENALHIYSCNEQVNAWNKNTLHKKCTDIICIEAQDTEINSKSKNKICDKPRKSRQSSLPRYLWIAVNARVMLIKNVDISKGLTNGCIGNVVEIVKVSKNSKPLYIKVKFDNDDIGTQVIEMQQESMGKKYSRRQFPLKLAYACTVHKVQGMTLKKAVVSLKRTFLSGQAYVALSRVTSLSGLVIEDFDPKLIHCNPIIKECLDNMNSYLESDKVVEKSNISLSMMLHNIQGLKQHYTDLQCNSLFMKSDCICLTETWLNGEDILDIPLDRFKLYHQARQESYSNTNIQTSTLKNQSHGGVAVFTKNKFSSRLNFNVKDLEFIAFIVTYPMSVAVSVVYRPPSYDVKVFCENVKILLENLNKVSTRSIVVGDFNENLFKGSSYVKKVMSDHGYQQHVLDATTEGDTLIDHVYSKGLDSLQVQVLPVYYSYHEAISIKY